MAVNANMLIIIASGIIVGSCHFDHIYISTCCS